MRNCQIHLLLLFWYFRDKQTGKCASESEVAVCTIPGPPGDTKKNKGKLVDEETAETGAVSMIQFW